jgi:hypothetical protein
MEILHIIARMIGLQRILKGRSQHPIHLVSAQ